MFVLEVEKRLRGLQDVGVEFDLQDNVNYCPIDGWNEAAREN